MVSFYYYPRVYLAEHKEERNQCALKVMKRTEDKDDSINSDATEQKAMESLDHPHIVRLLDKKNNVSLTKQNGEENEVDYFALELCNEGNLFDIIFQSGALSENLSRYYFQQMISALEYMHEEGFSHRDIKPSNILLDSSLKI